MSDNIYLPWIATITEVRPETADTSTFVVTFDDPQLRESFTYLPGQFAELSNFGVGECPIGIASSPTWAGSLEFCVRAVGTVTNAIHDLDVGDKLGVRGPLGNSWPIEEIEGKDLLFIGGGIGLPPLRSLIHYVLDNRERYGAVEIIYGARSPQDLVYKQELKQWEEQPDVDLYVTVDAGDGTWDGPVGFVPPFLREINPTPENKVAFTCGPPIMIKLVVEALEEMGYADANIVTTLEMKMKCGVGKCGRCNIGDRYVCRDGPVFSFDQLRRIPGALEA
ncbi:MAG: hydrogenase [Chloroflexi bacterium B3_Chlor]|nr:MAG: hydrogenase [Chloroflexi bacterium B3_Chlor]